MKNILRFILLSLTIFIIGCKTNGMYNTVIRATIVNNDTVLVDSCYIGFDTLSAVSEKHAKSASTSISAGDTSYIEWDVKELLKGDGEFIVYAKRGNVTDSIGGSYFSNVILDNHYHFTIETPVDTTK